MKWLGALFGAVILPLVLSEFTEWCPWLAERLVRRAARRLPEDARARWEEEWLADLSAWEGRKLSMLVRGIWIFLRAPSWARVLQGLPSFSQELRGRIEAFVRRLRERQTKPAQLTKSAQPTTKPDQDPQDPQLEALRRYVLQLGTHSAPERQSADSEAEAQIAALRRYVAELGMRPAPDQPASGRPRRKSETVKRSFTAMAARIGSHFSLSDELEDHTQLAVQPPEREVSFSIPHSATNSVTTTPFRVPPYVCYERKHNSGSG